MSTDSNEPIFPPAFWLWTLRALALVLIMLEISKTQTDYRVVEMYAPPDAQEIWDAIGRFRILHIVRIAILALMAIGWRWSFWLAVISYLIVYLPNPWVTGTLVNGYASIFLLFLAGLIACYSQKQFWMPWKNRKATVEQAEGAV